MQLQKKCRHLTSLASKGNSAQRICALRHNPSVELSTTGAPTKILTYVRLDADILEFFKPQGAGYLSRINAVLRMEVERKLNGRPKTTTHKQITP
jgi:uncharacterized protein (DUF4415 family)